MGHNRGSASSPVRTSRRRSWSARKAKAAQPAAAESASLDAAMVAPLAAAHRDAGRAAQHGEQLAAQRLLLERELTFVDFLRARGVQIWADHEDWRHMAETSPQTMELIERRFADAREMHVTTTRSFPHRWTFSAEVDGSPVRESWRGPPGPVSRTRAPHRPEHVADSLRAQSQRSVLELR